MSRLTELPYVRMWLADRLAEDVERSLKRLASIEDVVRLAVMPDVHLGTDVCNGVALATSRQIYPSAVGSDIGCGMLAVQFAGTREIIDNEDAARRLLTALADSIPELKHSRDSVPHQLPSELMARELSHPSLEKLKDRDARWQLGTLGRGNHFVEFQADDEGQLWVLIHSGSRGMGDAITGYHRRLMQTGPHDQNQSRSSGGLIGLDPELPSGQAYFKDQEWARKYASANRLAILDAVRTVTRQLFQMDIVQDTLIHSDHNHVLRTVDQGQEVWLHRKGAQSAGAGEVGVIPGSMGTFSVHVEGRGYTEALCSSSHGAGRKLSRTEAARTISVSQFRQQMSRVWYRSCLTPTLREEAPAAYRDLRRVMEAQHDLTRIIRTLRPVLSFKAGR